MSSQRIAINYQQVREGALLDDAQFALPSAEFGMT